MCYIFQSHAIGTHQPNTGYYERNQNMWYHLHGGTI